LSIATDLFGIPIGGVIDGANRNGSILLAPTPHAVANRGLLLKVQTIGLTDIVCAWNSNRNEGTRSLTTDAVGGAGHHVADTT